MTNFVSRDRVSDERFYSSELLLRGTVNGLPRLKIFRLLVQILLECILPWHCTLSGAFHVYSISPLETILENMKQLLLNLNLIYWLPKKGFSG